MFTAATRETPELRTLRLLMMDNEVNSIIGRRAEILRSIRQQSTAKINITEGCNRERIITIQGEVNATFHALTLICQRYDDYCIQFSGSKRAITMRILIGSTQCGSLIGKGGANIRDIRENTGVSVQIVADLLHNSNERVITTTGLVESVIDCIKQISEILHDHPPKSTLLLYVPKKIVSDIPVIISNDRPYCLKGTLAIPEDNFPILAEKPFW